MKKTADHSVGLTDIFSISSPLLEIQTTPVVKESSVVKQSSHLKIEPSSVTKIQSSSLVFTRLVLESETRANSVHKIQKSSVEDIHPSFVHETQVSSVDIIQPSSEYKVQPTSKDKIDPNGQHEIQTTIENEKHLSSVNLIGSSHPSERHSNPVYIIQPSSTYRNQHISKVITK